jgi:hypothetical protein
MDALVRRCEAGEIEAFLRQGDDCGWCRHPVRLEGRRVAVDPSNGARNVVFSSATLPDGVVLKACGNRRETRCPTCAAVYRSDARHLVRAGLEGGKGIDAAVAEHPAVLLTLTAPSFGAVHRARSGAPCRPGHSKRRCGHGRPVACFMRHQNGDQIVGTPICPDCYDYDGSVLHNAVAPELWRRTSIYIPRYLARTLGLTQAACRERFRVSYVRVAEFQRRGAVHLHVIVRLDTVDGEVPDVAAKILSSACAAAARAVSVSVAGRALAWGDQVDTSVLERGEARPRRVAAYVAKYATKSSESSGALDRRIYSAEDLAARRLPAHERRLATRAWALGSDETLEHLHLRRYAHVLGYGGHFLSKSRRYSTTFGSLRGARVAWREAHRARHDESPECSYESTWLAVGIGWANRGEAACAEQSREAAAYARRLARESEHDDD